MEVDVVSLASEFPNDNPALHRGVRWVCLSTTGAPTAEIEPEAEAPAVVEAVVEAVAEPEAVVEAVAEPEAVVEAVAEPEAVVEAVAEPEAVVEAVAAPEVVVEEPRISGIVAVAQRDEDDGAADEIIVEEIEPLDATATVEGCEAVPAAAPEPEPLSLVAAETLPPPAPAESSELPPAPDDPFTVFLCALADIAIGAGSPDAAAALPALLLDGRLHHEVTGDIAQALAEAGIVRDGVVTPKFAAETQAWRAILSGTSDDFDACGGAMLDEWAADLVACLIGARSRGAALRRDLRARGVAAFGLVEAA